MNRFPLKGLAVTLVFVALAACNPPPCPEPGEEIGVGDTLAHDPVAGQAGYEIGMRMRCGNI